MLSSLSIDALKSVAIAVASGALVYGVAFATIFSTILSHRQLEIAHAESEAARDERSRMPKLAVYLWLRGPHTEPYYPGTSGIQPGRTTNFLGIYVNNSGDRVATSVHVSILVPNDLTPETIGGYEDVATFSQGLTTELRGRYWHEFHLVTTTPIHPGSTLLVGQILLSTSRALPGKLLWSLQHDADHFPRDQQYGEIPMFFTFYESR